MGTSSISNRVCEFRFHSGEMTQQQLADPAGVTRQTIVAKLGEFRDRIRIVPGMTDDREVIRTAVAL